MGWQLVGEVLEHCPDLPYRDFRLLVAFAWDARDQTRQGLPGHETLALLGNCGLRTVERRMRALADRGLIKKVRPSAPGVRAVYELLPAGVDNLEHPPLPVAGEHPPPSDQRPPPRRRTPATTGGGPEVISLSHISSARVSDIVRAAYPDATDDEIEGVVQTVRAEHNPANVVGYIAAMAGNGDLKLPCGPGRAEWPGPRSTFCLGEGGDRSCPQAPPKGWCHCRCHLVPRGAAS